MSYMVSVEGGQAPTVIHQTYASAQQEAERLAQQPRNNQRTIHVLKLVSTLRPTTIHRWEHRAAPSAEGQEILDTIDAQGAELMAKRRDERLWP